MLRIISQFCLLFLLGSSLLPAQRLHFEDNAELFNYLKRTILERHAVSQLKHDRLGIDLEAQIEARREQFIASETIEDLYFEVLAISNLRRDSHLKMAPIYVERKKKEYLPIRLEVDFSDPESPFLFVRERALGNNGPARPGDRLLSVGEWTFGEVVAQAKLLIPSSTDENFHCKLARFLTKTEYNLSRLMGQDTVAMTFENQEGVLVEETFTFVPKKELEWEKREEYPGFKRLLETDNFWVYLHPEEEKVLLLKWTDFDKDLPADVDHLIEWARMYDRLDNDLIIDATRSGGGSNSNYAIRRLSPYPWRVTKGDLRISDILEEFIPFKCTETDKLVNDPKLKAQAERAEVDAKGTVCEWLKTSVNDSIQAGAAYSEKVVFKLMYDAPNDTIYPAEEHFTGKMVLLTHPRGGSQLDQFASLLIDNDLAYSIGMPTGGLSNTWEWSVALKYPGSARSFCMFAWTIGLSYRPNGEVLEGNPPPVDEFFPPTAANILNYENLLVERALEYLERNR